MIDHHYILTLEQLALPQHLRIFLAANMNSTFYPSKARYFLAFQTAFTKWLRIQGLPPSLTQHLEPFLQHQWKLHIDHLKQQPRFTARLLRQLQEFLGDQVVLHHADHELQQLRIFCPRQYFTGALATWQTPELFAPMPTLQSSNIHDYLTQTIPASEKTSRSHTASSTSKRRSTGGKVAPLSHTSNPSAVTSSALPAEPSTLSCNTSFHSFQVNYQSHNCGPTSTATSTTHHPTSPYMPPTMILWAFSTQFHSAA